jgi:glycosyltransferase involved in cell wall biosynthesis
MLGFEMARGEYVATLDADLQDDPKSIRTLYKVLTSEDYDFLTGWRKNRKDSPKKVLSSKLFNNVVIPFLFGIKIHDHNGGLKLYRSSVAKELQLYGGMHRFIAILVNEMGYKTGEHEVIHHPRKYGHSKYKFTKIISDIPDLFTIYFLTKYTRRPLHFFGKIGAVLFLIGSMVLIYLSVIHFMGASIGRRPLLFFGILMQRINNLIGKPYKTVFGVDRVAVRLVQTTDAQRERRAVFHRGQPAGPEAYKIKEFALIHPWLNSGLFLCPLRQHLGHDLP